MIKQNAENYNKKTVSKRRSLSHRQNSSLSSNHSNKVDDNCNLDHFLLDIGGPSIIQASVLTPQGRSMVNPLLQEFAKQVCSSVAKHCIIKLAD